MTAAAHRDEQLALPRKGHGLANIFEFRQRAIRAGRLSCMPFQIAPGAVVVRVAREQHRSGHALAELPDRGFLELELVAPPSEMPRMLVSAWVATGACLLQPGSMGVAAATLAARVVRQN